MNDAARDPLFVVTAEAKAGLAKMLPPVLDEVRALVAGFDLLTYRKGRNRSFEVIC